MRCRLALFTVALLALLTLALLAIAAPASAQVPTPVPPTSIDVIVIAPGTSDPNTAPALATSRTLVAAGGAMCNQVPLTTIPVGNPTIAEIDDPFAGPAVKCRLAIPVGLPNGVNYRAVAVANGVCAGVPCSSARSLVGVPPFAIAGIPAPPVVPTGLAVKP